MSLVDALVLAVVQGLTEFLPVSSSGHLVLAGALLGVGGESHFLYVILLHLASAAAIAVAYWRDWWSLCRAEGRRLWLPIIIGTVPAALLGVLFEDAIEALFTDPRVASVGLLVTATALVLAERQARGDQTVETGGLGRAALVGGAQAIAMVPGISRSGSCLATGLWAGYERAQAVRLAFLLGLPIIAGAGAWKLVKLALGKEQSPPLDVTAAVVGFLVCAVVSFASIRLLQAVARKRCLWIFAAWCAVVGVISLIWLSVPQPVPSGP